MGEVTLPGGVETMLSHMALLGLGAILEDADVAEVRLRWSVGMEPRAVVSTTDLDAAAIAHAVREHAATRHDASSWVQADQDVSGTRRALMSPRVAALTTETWPAHADARHAVLQQLTDSRAWTDLRMVWALGKPAYWSRNRQGQVLQDDGATRLEMQPRNQGSEFVGARLRKVAAAVTGRDDEQVLDGLLGRSVRDEVGKDNSQSRTPTGFAPPGPADNALVWCALWGISQLPVAPRTNATAATSGHIGRSRREWFYLPVWTPALRPARVRTVLASEELLVAASADLPARVAAPPAQAMAANRWLADQGVTGVVRFPIERFGSDSAPERRAMRGHQLRTST